MIKRACVIISRHVKSTATVQNSKIQVHAHPAQPAWPWWPQRSQGRLRALLWRPWRCGKRCWRNRMLVSTLSLPSI